MGWKAAALFATSEPGYFGTLPSHDAESAEGVRSQLGLTGYEPAAEKTFDTAIYPAPGALFIGAYPRGVIVCDRDLPHYFFDDRPRRTISGTSIRFKHFKSNFLGLYPGGQVLAIVLHSVVNLWGYSLYANGQLVRSAAGASDNGLIVDVGAPLPEEARALKECPIEKVDEEGNGEEMVFEVAARMMGGRIDEIEGLTLRMSGYKRKSLVKRLFGRT